MPARQALCAGRRDHGEALPAAGRQVRGHARGRGDNHTAHGQQQDAGAAGTRVGRAGPPRGHAPLAAGEHWRGHGDRPRGLRRLDIQARHKLHKHPNHAAGHGRRIGGRQDRNKLRRAEKRGWSVQQRQLRDTRHRVPAHNGHGEHALGLCRDAEARPHQRRADMGRAARVRHRTPRPGQAEGHGGSVGGGEGAHSRTGPH